MLKQRQEAEAILKGILKDALPFSTVLNEMIVEYTGKQFRIHEEKKDWLPTEKHFLYCDWICTCQSGRQSIWSFGRCCVGFGQCIGQTLLSWWCFLTFPFTCCLTMSIWCCSSCSLSCCGRTSSHLGERILLVGPRRFRNPPTGVCGVYDHVAEAYSDNCCCDQWDSEFSEMSEQIVAVTYRLL